MKNKGKRGISLIVLVITIIVIIILAAAIIISISKNNPIDSASKATISNNIVISQDAYTMYITNKIDEKNGVTVGRGIIKSGNVTSSVTEVGYEELVKRVSSPNNLKLEELGIKSKDVGSIAVVQNKVVGIEIVRNGKSKYYKKEGTEEITKEEYLKLVEKIKPNISGNVEINLSTSKYTNQNIEVELKYNGEIPEDYVLQYKIDNGDFKEYTGKFILTKNATIKAVLYSDTYMEEQAGNSKEVTNIDKEKPTNPKINISVTENKIQVVASGSIDKGTSGIAGYAFSEDGINFKDVDIENGKNESKYEIDKLKSSTTRNIYIKAYDGVEVGTRNESEIIEKQGTTKSITMPNLSITEANKTSDGWSMKVSATLTGTAPNGYKVEYRLLNSSEEVVKDWTEYTGVANIEDAGELKIEGRYYNEVVDEVVLSNPISKEFKKMAEFDFIEKMPRVNSNVLVPNINDPYYTLAKNAISGADCRYSYYGFAHANMPKTTNPGIYNSDKGSYIWIGTKNPIGYNFKYLEIEVRTTNNGGSSSTCRVGFASSDRSEWINGLYWVWTGANTNSWTSKKGIITVPDGTNTSTYTFIAYIGHSNTYGFNGYMDFITIKGYYKI